MQTMDIRIRRIMPVDIISRKSRRSRKSIRNWRNGDDWQHTVRSDPGNLSGTGRKCDRIV